MALTRVVFPDPFGPISPRISPGSKGASDTASRARSPGEFHRDGGRFEWQAIVLRTVRKAPAGAHPCRARADGNVRCDQAILTEVAGSLDGVRQPRKCVDASLTSTSTAALSGA